jgi:hypothetical protein
MRLVRATGEQPLRTDAAIGIAVPASGQVCLAVAHRVHLDRINARGVVAIHVDQMIVDERLVGRGFDDACIEGPQLIGSGEPSSLGLERTVSAEQADQRLEIAIGNRNAVPRREAPDLLDVLQHTDSVFDSGHDASSEAIRLDPQHCVNGFTRLGRA